MIAPTTATVLASLLAAAVPSLAAPAVVSDADCDCFVSDGPYPTYFKNHGFWDFRSLSQFARVPPVIRSSVQDNYNAPFTSTFFNWDSQLTQFWGPQRWQKPGTGYSTMINSYNNLYIEKNTGGESDTFMTMRTNRMNDFQTAAEMESNNVHDHASIRVHSRTTGSSGACTSVFTYLGADQPKDVQEADIELLTRDPHTDLHYTNQPGVLNGDEVPGASKNISIPFGKSFEQWLTHRIDWIPGRTVYSIDNYITQDMTFQAPRDPSRIILNAWSDGGVWTGAMPPGGEARQQVQWIEILYNVVNRNSCNRVCSVDSSPQLGKPVRV